MDRKIKNAIEITWIIANHIHKENHNCIPFLYTELKDFIGMLTEKFEDVHPDSDWNELDYYEEITEFTNRELAKALWQHFGNVHMNQETEKIEEDWNGFPAGTLRKDIVEWFEDTFGVDDVEDLMGL